MLVVGVFRGRFRFPVGQRGWVIFVFVSVSAGRGCFVFRNPLLVGG